MQERSFLSRIKSVYADRERTQEDVFGRRQATPREIADAISTDIDFESGLEHFLPDQEVIEEKDAGATERRHK